MAAQEDNLPMLNVVVIGAASVLGTLALVILLVGLTRREEGREFHRKVVQVPHPQVEAVRGEQRNRLAGYGWVDREAGQVQIPIERAMGLLSMELRQGGSAARPPAAGQQDSGQQESAQQDSGQ